MQLPGNSSAETVLRRFDDQHNKYKFMEANLRQKKQRCAFSTAIKEYISHIYIYMHPKAESSNSRYSEVIRRSRVLED